LKGKGNRGVKLILGLGNPGIEYQFTPHNAGFLAVDRIAEYCNATISNRRGRALTGKVTLAGNEILLAKPETYMNLSGLSAAALVRELEIPIPSQDLIVIYDELDLPLGAIRIRERGFGERAQRSEVDLRGAWHGRVVEDPASGLASRPSRMEQRLSAGGKDFLLNPMRKQELAVLDEVLDRVRNAVEVILTKGPGPAMSQFNGSNGSL